MNKFVNTLYRERLYFHELYILLILQRVRFGNIVRAQSFGGQFIREIFEVTKFAKMGSLRKLSRLKYPINIAPLFREAASAGF